MSKCFSEQLKPIEKYALNFLELFHTLNDQKSQKVNKVSDYISFSE